MSEPFVDIHCHMLPALDDGAQDAVTARAMARMAVEDGFRTTIVTPHQLGNFAHNRGNAIRRRTAELAAMLAEHDIPLSVLPGGDVRIEEGLVQRVASGEVMTLGDHGRHVLLELPHELYVPLEPLLDNMATAGLVGILSHPERNAGILRHPELLWPLVDRGCLMQVTAGSVTGSFGEASQHLAEWMLCEGLVHFLATDAHGIRSRRPRLQPAFERVVALAGEATAVELCCSNPASIATGQDVSPGRLPNGRTRRGGSVNKSRSWWPWSKAS